MELDSPLFWVIFFVSVLILMARARKKRPELPTKPKGVSGKVAQVTSPLRRETPLSCLLDDSKKFGPLFQDKNPPVLPHTEGCQCQLSEFYTDSNKLYAGKVEGSNDVDTDLGNLAKLERRYYKYRLILAHPDCPPHTEEETQNLLNLMDLEPSFQEKITQHLEGNL